MYPKSFGLLISLASPSDHYAPLSQYRSATGSQVLLLKERGAALTKHDYESVAQKNQRL